MQYIKDDRRYTLQMAPWYARDAGELNYAITILCLKYAGQFNYAKINEVIGVLECAKLEFYRRLAAPYEDTKIKENGDVYL